MWPGANAAPAIHTRSKVLYGPLDEDRALRRAARMARGVDVPLPVIFGRRIIGVALGLRDRSEVILAKTQQGYRCGIGSYDEAIAAVTASAYKKREIWVSKRMSTGGAAFNWFDMWTVGGASEGGAFGGAARTAVQKSGSTTGAFPLGGNVSPATRYLFYSQLLESGLSPCDVMLYDRVLTYEACGFSGSSQAMTNSVAAQRYIGAGEGGLKVMVTVQTATNGTAANISVLTYTDQDGNGSSAMPTSRAVAVLTSVSAPSVALGARVIAPADAGASVLWGPPFLPLAAGDSGVRSVEDYTFSAAPTGTFCVVLCRPLGYLILHSADGRWHPVDAIQQVEAHPVVFDSACLSLLLFTTTTNTGSIGGNLGFAWS